MGIVNVTPDSFSDGGEFVDAEVAIRHARLLVEQGAEIIDVGGESTRPGAAPTPPEEEARRVVPVVRALAEAGAVVSIDTRRAAVMGAALEAGAHIVNDVTGLTGDPESLAVVASAKVPVVLMHMKGDPTTMQDLAVYDDVVLEIAQWLDERIAACALAGIPREKIVVDPGIGFAKTGAHNLEILARLATFHGLGCGILLGASRKGFIGRLARAATPKDRVPGSLAAALAALAQGVHILRVHDVAATRQAVALWQAIADAG
jgi:dihydropteroate synthase